MSDPNATGWPFAELPAEDGFDINAIFGSNPGANQNPFESPQVRADDTPTAPPVQEPVAPPAPVVESPASKDVAPAAVPVSTPAPTPPPAPPAPPKSVSGAPEVSGDGAGLAGNPIEAAFAQKTMENAQKGLLERAPVFYHKGVKEDIEDASMTFEELRIRKSEDFTDLEEGKYVSWSVEYCGIRKEVKDPKGTTIISMKETIERSREFLEALKKAKDKNPSCYIKPKVVMKNKGLAASYKGEFRTLEEARESDKVICLIPSSNGKLYELRKTEQGEFIAPKTKVAEFQRIRAGFTPALPLIPMLLMFKIISFFRSFMETREEYEALALIYWDKWEEKFFAYVPKQIVRKEHIEADLRECPYDDDERYIHYCDIHSHNSMDAFFSAEDDLDERATGLYLVLGRLQDFYPDIKARIFCGGTFLPIDPATVVEGMEAEYPLEWAKNVTYKQKAKRQPPVWTKLPDLADMEAQE